MKRLLFILSLLAISGCAISNHHAEGQAAETDKGGYSDELTFGEWTNRHRPEIGELEKLVLTEVAPSELPKRYYEGRYELIERTDNGSKTSSGYFNAYRYGGENWLRFHDDTTGKATTTYDKFLWVIWDGTLVMAGHGADQEFFMELPFYGTQTNCKVTAILDDNILEEGLSIHEYPDVSIEANSDSGRIQLGVGAFSFDTEDGDRAEFLIERGTARAGADMGEDATLYIEGPADGRGDGIVTLVTETTETPVAKMTCEGKTTRRPGREVTCTLSRRADVPYSVPADMPASTVNANEAGITSAKLTVTEEEEVASSDGLFAYEGSYSFDLYSTDETGFEVLFYENMHVTDEVGGMTCDLQGVEAGRSFCNEPIEIDKLLGTDSDVLGGENVEAFDFSCTRK